jgi:hypothetical protein
MTKKKKRPCIGRFGSIRIQRLFKKIVIQSGSEG